MKKIARRLMKALFGGCALLAMQLPWTASAAEMPSLRWVPTQYARIEGKLLKVDVPANAPRGSYGARAAVDLSAFSEKGFSAEIRATGKGITEPPQAWNGLKFMFHYVDPNGEKHWPNTASKLGDFPWQTLRVVDFCPGRKLGKAELTLGLQDSTGSVTFDLSTLKLAAAVEMYPRTNQNWRVSYPARVRDLPPQRGVMLPGGNCTEDDFRTLSRWGATLARYQMIRGWHKQNDNQDLADYDRWLDGKVDHLLRDVLPWARKYGIRIVVDLHVPPGGRNHGEMNMFHEARWADHFVACWRRIAQRCQGHPEIYGYDLINEPQQQLPSPPGLDYWNVQRRAAEAVRAIDPDTSIIIESNGWDSAAPYAYLSPLAMDNVIYQVHMYVPGEFTHQGVSRQDDNYHRTKWPDQSKKWNRDFIERQLQPVLEFRKRHNARIYVGEFSAITWAEGAENYIADCISIFEKHGFDWTYHAFREWSGWSVEHESVGGKFSSGARYVASADNPRKRALLHGLEHELFRSGTVWNGERIASYRIPAICRTKDGTLIAACDQRCRNAGDLNVHQPIRIVYRRSKDDGATWTENKRMHDLRWDSEVQQSASDPSLLVDETTGAVFCFWNSWEWVKDKGHYRFFVQRSDDSGASWSPPREITNEVMRPEWQGKPQLFITSGHGAQLRDGTLVHTLVWVNQHKLGLFGSTDHGQTWKPMGSLVGPADECKIVELKDGAWMVNTRLWKGRCRGVHISRDRGATWETRMDEKLIDPACNGALLRLADGRLAFSNCISSWHRAAVGVRFSADEGKTWGQQTVVDMGPSAYSDIVQLGDGRIGVLYEQGPYRSIRFATIPLPQ